MSHRPLFSRLSAAALLAGASIALPAVTFAQQDPLDPPVASEPPQPPDPVDPRSCVGRGARQQNGLMASEEYRHPLRVFSPDGRGAERALTHPRRRQDSKPAWSPNGRRVAFERGAGSVAEIWTVEVASRRARRVVRDAVTPAWSPDGRWISYGGHDGLSAIRPDGTGARLIGTTYRSVEYASWSPNGRCLAGRAYDKDGLGDNLGLAIMDSSGGTPTVIFRLRPRFQESWGAAPSWSRDGRHLLIVAQSVSSSSVTRLVRVNLDGTGGRLLTRFRDIMHAAYSPDGRTIAFSRRKIVRRALTNTGGTYSMPAGGGPPRLIVPRRYAAVWGPRAR